MSERDGRKLPTIFLVAIGNELLNAEIRDSNLAWLIKRFTNLGGIVKRAVIIPDDFEAIKCEVDTAREQKIRLILTTGGLGPTDDDATFKAIAYSLGVKARLNPIALGMVKERIEALAVFRPGIPRELNRERKSQAVLPVGGIPLYNPVGVAPGLKYELGETTLICLPGVPQEMKGIVSETLKDFWREFFGSSVYTKRNIVVKGIPEAELAPYIRRANKIDREVYIKSRLKLDSKPVPMIKPVEPEKLKWQIILHFSVWSDSKGEGRKRLERVIGFLTENLREDAKWPYYLEL